MRMKDNVNNVVAESSASLSVNTGDLAHHHQSTHVIDYSVISVFHFPPVENICSVMTVW